MADANKLVTLIALFIVGLIIAAWGIIYMWLHRNDTKIIEESLAKGEISVADAARLSSNTWWWVLSITQIIIGIGLIFWGIFQYFTSVERVVTKVKEYVPEFGVPVRTETTATRVVSGATSRRGAMNSNTVY